MGSIAKKIVPLSFSQQRLWFLNQLESGFPAYNISLAYHVRGLLNIVALERSLGEIIKRHETLRTAFPFVNGQPIQCISQDVAFKLQIVDLREVAEANREVESKRLATKEDREAFDLQKGPLLRVKLLCLNEAEYVLLLSTHYIVCDTWSLKILMRELSAFYEAFCSGISLRLPELPIQYGDFAVWQCKWLHDKVLESQLAYWKHKLSGHLSVLELPTDRPRPPVQTYRGAKQSLVLPKCLTEAIKAFCQREGVTLFMTLLAAFKTLLYRYTGQEDIIVGSPIANRNRTEIKDLIGCFLNILVMRTDLGGNPTFRELVSQVSDVVVGAYIHQDLPFEKLIEEIQLDQVLSYNPLFQVLFVLQDAPTLAVELSYLTITYLDTDRGTAKFDLSLLIENTGKEFIAVLEYRTDLFDDTTVTRMLGHLQTLLKGIVANPEERISTLPILTEAELHQLLVKWNPQPPDPSWNLCYTHLFESQVQKRPNAVAVVFEDQELTYQELDYRANQVGNHLRSLGVGPEVLVGICMERSLELAVGILGILKAGGACVPLAPEYPMERLALMLEDTQVKVLLTQRRILKQIPQHEAHVVCMDNWAVFAKESIVSPEIKVQPDNLAYVVYTSGSTGRPKGVMLTHRRFCGRESLLPSTEADRYLLKSGTLIELLWALRDGGRGIIARPGGHRDSAYYRYFSCALPTTTSSRRKKPGDLH
jgi:non-ribosomal peptide synthetase component F